MLLCIIGIVLNHPHASLSHEVRIPLVRLINFDAPDFPLIGVAATEIFELGGDFDHSCEGVDGDVLGVEADKAG